MNEDEDEPLPMPPPLPLAAFSAVGIELEYMIVDRASLSVQPLADRLLHEAAGAKVNEVGRGMLAWSNELVLHVIEIKNPRPVASLGMLPDAFQDEIREINRRLGEYGARLMPTAMHPWMDPRSETHLWPHDNNIIYDTYARIFDTRSHGWANLQSMHINLPFANNDEFVRLHAAIRLVLPILPALAASSPIADGRHTGWADYRMHVYAGNAKAIPSIAGMVVPETVASRAAYEQRILAPMYRDLAPHDPERTLQHEWLNSRGAIARFDRNAIEIRVIDTQECPQADLAVAAATVEAVRMLYGSGSDTLVAQQEISTAALASIFQDCIRDADEAIIRHRPYLQLLGVESDQCQAGRLWRHLIERMIERMEARGDGAGRPWIPAWQSLLDAGPLARRILRAVDGDYSHAHLRSVYEALCDCLGAGEMFGVAQ